jgi:hypothetical protein
VYGRLDCEPAEADALNTSANHVPSSHAHVREFECVYINAALNVLVQ